MKKIIGIVLIFVIAISLFSPSILSVSDEVIIDIFHTGNINGNAEKSDNSIGFAKLKDLIDKSTANGKIVLDAGNLFSGKPFATKTSGESIAKIIAAIPYTAITIGNNDFSYNQARISELASNYKINVLSVNVKDKNVPAYKPYYMKTINGVNIGILGITTPIIKTTVNELLIDVLEFGDKKSILNDAKNSVSQLKSQGADIIIAITHLGINKKDDLTSEDIANEVQGINLIIDGNSREITKDGKLINSVMIASTGKNFEAVGISKIKYDKSNKKIISVTEDTYSAKNLAGAQESVEIINLISKIKNDTKEIDKTLLINSKFNFGENKIKDYSKTGNLIALCLQSEAAADGAIISSGEIKGTISAGEITREKIEKILPNGNTILFAKVSGKWLKDYFSKSINSTNEAFPELSGIKLYYKKSFNKNVVTDINIAGKSVKSDDSYTIATTDSILEEFDSYESYIQSDTVHEVCIRQISMNPDILKQANEQVPIFKSDKSNFWYIILIIAVLTLIASAYFIWIFIKRNEKSPQ